MLIREFRVVLPISVPEYQVGQLYAVAEASKKETGGGEGVEIVENVPYDDPSMPGGKGQYTHKIYHLETKVPKIVRMIAPKGALKIHEKAWNAYPFCRTVLTNPDYMKENFELVVQTIHKADNGNSSNVHELTGEQLRDCEIVKIDIANDTEIPKQQGEDPALWHSEKTGRGPLGPAWIGEYGTTEGKPIMTCYKLVTVHFKWWGLQNKIESYVQKLERKIFTSFHRQVVCWLDNWFGMTMDDIRALEAKAKTELDEAREKGEKRGQTAEVD